MIKYLENLLDTYIIKYHNKKLIKVLNLNSIKTVIDIGSHKAELYKTLTNSNLEIDRYIAFEPVKSLYKNLVNEYKKNPAFEVLNIALSNKEGSRNIKINTFSSTHTFSTTNENKLKYKIKNFLSRLQKDEFEKLESVQMNYLDNLNLGIKNTVQLVKIDTEGHELETLQGSLMFFKEHKPEYLIIEFQKKDNYKNYDPNKIKKLINQLGYAKIKSVKGPFNLFIDTIYKLNIKIEKK